MEEGGGSREYGDGSGEYRGRRIITLQLL